MQLSDVATIKVGLENAHFWLVRRGSIQTVGKPTRSFNSEHIGIEVLETQIVLPDYLYFCMMHLHNTGIWRRNAHGSLSLVNIRVKDVQKITLG